MELITEESIRAAREAFDNGTIVEIFGAFFHIEAVSIRNRGITLNGKPVYRVAEVEFTPTTQRATES